MASDTYPNSIGRRLGVVSRPGHERRTSGRREARGSARKGLGYTHTRTLKDALKDTGTEVSSTGLLGYEYMRG